MAGSFCADAAGRNNTVLALVQRNEEAEREKEAFGNRMTKKLVDIENETEESLFLKACETFYEMQS